jgi:hypothetical protein
MTTLWHIDTIDARSGYAFTSRRTADLLDETALSDNVDTFFIEAPHFMPERVSSRAVSFGAARAGFQVGYYRGGDEVGFPSLSAVADFVRRAYGSGGSSDDGGGGTPPPPPIEPNDNPPDREPYYQDGFDPVKALSQAIEQFVQMVKSADRDRPVPVMTAFDGLLPSAIPATIDDASAYRLGRAALTLAIHVLTLRPVGLDETAKTDASMRSLTCCITRMGLWQAVVWHLGRDDADRLRLDQVLREFLRTLTHSERLVARAEENHFLDSPHNLTALLYIVSLLGFDGPPKTYELLLHRFRYWDTCLPAMATHSSERYAELAHIVIPHGLIPSDLCPVNTAPTLRNLLAFACHSPAQIVQSRSPDTSMELLLFAACSLHNFEFQSIAGGAIAPHWLSYLHHDTHTAYNAHKLVAAALPWIRSNFPQYAFHEDLERDIANTAALR